MIPEPAVEMPVQARVSTRRRKVRRSQELFIMFPFFDERLEATREMIHE